MPMSKNACTKTLEVAVTSFTGMGDGDDGIAAAMYEYGLQERVRWRRTAQSFLIASQFTINEIKHDRFGPHVKPLAQCRRASPDWPRCRVAVQASNSASKISRA